MTFFFPPEIEDNIFQWVLYIHPYQPADVQLATVSKRVQKCIEQKLYHTVKFWGSSDALELDEYKQLKYIYEKDFELALLGKPKSFFHNNVKNVFFAANVSSTFFSWVLSRCTGVQNLTFWYKYEESPIQKHVIGLPLRSLELDISMLHHLAKLQQELPEVTYLTVHGEFDKNVIPHAVLRCLPALTHVVFDPIENNDKNLSDSLVIILDNVQRLQLITILKLEHYMGPGSKRLMKEWKRLDPRIEIVDAELKVRFWHERMENGTVNFDGRRYGEERPYRRKDPEYSYDNLDDDE